MIKKRDWLIFKTPHPLTSQDEGPKILRDPLMTD